MRNRLGNTLCLKKTGPPILIVGVRFLRHRVYSKRMVPFPMTLRAKYSMTQSIVRPVCDSWASWYSVAHLLGRLFEFCNKIPKVQYLWLRYRWQWRFRANTQVSYSRLCLLTSKVLSRCMPASRFRFAISVCTKNRARSRHLRSTMWFRTHRGTDGMTNMGDVYEISAVPFTRGTCYVPSERIQSD